jgi:transposase InsO family protein
MPNPSDTHRTPDRLPIRPAATSFIADTLATHSIEPDQFSLHADRGTSMTSKPVAQLLVDLGVARSHSRPHVSNDNDRIPLLVDH